jgi:hypothetical protein
VRTLAEIIDGGLYHAAVERNLRNTNSVAHPDSEEYRESIAKRSVVRETVLKVMDSERLDALAYPTLRRTAARIGEAQRGGNCSLSSVSDLPAITVPAGFAQDDGLPVGLELLGRQFSDGTLVKFAYAFEQGTRHRRPPALTSPPAANGSAHLEVRATGSGHVPPVDSPAAASVRLDFDAATRRLGYAIELSGVNAEDVLSVDVHRGAQGARGPIVLVLSRFGPLASAGEVVLSPSEAAELAAGGLYLDVHTRKYVSGEVRAQLAVR